MGERVKSPRIGVLLMAYGTPSGADSMKAYYTHIRKGKPPTDEQLATLRERYEAIGGSSPLLRICEAQAEGLAKALDASAPGRWHVVLGMKHAAPFIEDGIETLVHEGTKTAVCLVLAPHRSLLSVDEYFDRASVATKGRMDLRFVNSWHKLDPYLDLLAERIRDAADSFHGCALQDLDVVFTAHSLPQRILEWDDPYPRQLQQTAEAVAARTGLRRFSIAWQSAGRTPEPWLGPDILEVTKGFAAAGSRGVIVCPAGFTSDHLEILYDLDVECKTLASRLGLPWRRTESLNAEPALLSGLAGLVRDAADRSAPERALR